jgi:GT2 family glycosyltransferase
MKISVVIPNYNGMNFLPSCLNSLENDKSNYLYIIIVDNGSNDRSKEFLEDKIDNNQESNIKYCLISNDSNLGFSKAVNQGIQLANTQDSHYVCLLNNDVEIEPDFLDNLIKVIEKDENVFSVSSKMLQYNNKDLIDDAGDEYTLLGWTKRSGYGKSLNSYSKERETFSSCAGASLYRKSVFNKIGYFDENFFAYMEDVDIGYRARINGFKNFYSPKAIVYHHGSGTSGSRYNKFKIRIAARNNVWTIYKNMPNLQILINIGFLTIGFLIKYLFFLRMGYGKIYLGGLKEGISNRKKIKRIKFKSSNLKNYFKIEWRLIVNTFRLIFK